jgi:hypothetical protein
MSFHQPESSAENLSMPDISLTDFQRLIRDMYFDKDIARGVDGTFMWLMEEVGELAAAIQEEYGSGSHIATACSLWSDSTKSGKYCALTTKPRKRCSGSEERRFAFRP